MSEIVVVTDDRRREPLEGDDRHVTLPSEFLPWAVRWTGVNDNRPIYVGMSSEFVKLIRSTDGLYRLSKTKREKIGGAAAGIIRFYTDDPQRAERVPLAPTIVVEPTLPPSLHRALIRDLRRLAFGLSTCEVYELGGVRLREANGRPPTPLQRLLRRANQLADVCEVLRRQRPLMHFEQLSELDRERVQVSHTEAARRGLRLIRSQGTSHRVTALQPVLRPNATEHRYVNTLIRDMHNEVDLITESLQAEINAEATWLPETFLRGVIDIPDRPSPPATDAIRARLTLDLETPDVPVPEYVPSNRLLLSLDFGPVVQAWMEYLASWPDASSGAGSVAHALALQSVLPTNSLYERWVLLTLVDALVTVGFSPEGRGLMEDIEVSAGEMRLRGQSWRYARPDGTTVVVKAEPSVPRPVGNPLTPDIVLEVSSGADHGVRTFVIDAKYRDHSRMESRFRAYEANPDSIDKEPYQYDEVREYGGSYFLLDRRGTIENKYLQLPGMTAGFIADSDPDSAYEYWDEWRSRSVAGDPLGAPPHRAMSIRLVPGVSWLGVQKVKLLACLFGFHCGLTDICWRCGSPGEKQDANAQSQATGMRSKGDAYLCPMCSLFWVDTWCYDNRTAHRPLLKYGAKHSFEWVAEHNQFNVACPWCGSTLGSARHGDYRRIAAGDHAAEEPGHLDF